MKNSKTLIILAFIAIYFIWGSTYLFNKIAVTELPPFFLASIRFFVAGILMSGLALLSKQKLAISKKQLSNSVIAAFFFMVYGNGVFVWALKFVDSGFGALLASTQPLFVLFLLRLIDRKPFQKKSLIGVALGMIGMYLLVSQVELRTSEGSLLGIFMILTCVLSWSYGSVFVSKADLPKSFMVSTGYQMLAASFILFIVSISLNEQWSSPLTWSTNVQISMLILIVFGGIFAFTAFNYLLKVVSPEKVSTSAYVNPVIALFMGWYFLDEVLSTQSVIASIVLLTGVYFITSRKRK
ncbi:MULTISPECIES: EamA family transporter [unclassified Polaribacter]|uniref:EamA family transporter n=1 Tax=unclassified Polaribacter TaxID=196858 RepID=UPI00052CFDA6|nr:MULTISPECIES: EamA family transporter [unclassified Polaribacter]MBT3741605.1 EamA family transporter [Polaribacter sp.]KGL60956.1 drug/metabolite permease [Polaribacter sp. Hel1_33_49]MBT4414522.1 EamA family transporter [Polaribacter sp.]MBT7815908.1 EamA family transporter [Polaribacter sp.]PKV64759.1 drug/metabolite transporter (DMT)-like permease [Polaribacter sp. Hel1_33_96]